MSHSLACGGLLLALAIVTPAFSQQKPPQPPVPKVTCIATNRSYILVTHNADGTAGAPVEKDDFYLHCTITIDGKVVYDKPLPTTHPLEWPEASVAINEFRVKKANEILKREGK